MNHVNHENPVIPLKTHLSAAPDRAYRYSAPSPPLSPIPPPPHQHNDSHPQPARHSKYRIQPRSAATKTLASDSRAFPLPHSRFHACPSRPLATPHKRTHSHAPPRASIVRQLTSALSERSYRGREHATPL